MKAIKRPQLTNKHLKLMIDRFEKALANKINKKGMNTWVSRHEIYGFVAEEFYELMKSLHENHHTNFEEELIDVMVSCLWGLASIRKLKEDGIY
jgi:hypothetical protein